MKPGLAFPDSILTEKRWRHFSSKPSFSEDPRMRQLLLIALLVLSFGFVLMRLVHLQLVEGVYYRKLSDSNRTKTETIRAPRGIVFDRNGVSLIFNIPGFRKTEGEKTQLLTRERALKLIAKGDEDMSVDVLREYPYKEVFSHAVGYVGEVTREELQSQVPYGTWQSRNVEGYRLGDRVGRMGVEQQYEARLRGTDGKKLVEVDNKGKVVRTLGKVDPIHGNDVTLTLDANVQQAANKAFAKVERGAVVASTLQGEVLVVLSKPSFDPNLFTLDDTYTVATSAAYRSVEEVLSDTKNQPFLNRAISGVYPPGSTFKLITAAAGLEEKVIDETFTVNDTGVISIGEFSFSNWYFTQYGKTDGVVDVVKGIKRSNDIFFYKLAEVVGVDRLSAMAKRFGVGEKLGIDLPGEAGGIVPTQEWKKASIGEPWYLGDTYHYGIGQGYVLTTPLQVNMWTSVIANGGILYEPHLIKSQKSKVPLRPPLAWLRSEASKSQKFLSDKTIELIRRGMVESCSPGGVAWPLFAFKVKNAKLKIDGKNFLEVPESTVSASFKDHRRVSIACKTGTAQQGGKEDLPHAWITLFAPAYDPQIVVTVLVEASGEGSNVAAPIAKKILEEWFER